MGRFAQDKKSQKPPYIQSFEGQNTMVAPLTIHAARCKMPATLRKLFQNETGSSVVEYLLMLSLVSIGAKTILGNYASISNTLVQSVIDGLRTVFPS